MRRVRHSLNLLLFLGLTLICSGCKTTSGSTTNSRSDARGHASDAEPHSYPTNATPARYTNDVRVVNRCVKWNPIWWFGNVDSPMPPDWYRPDDKSRARRWYWRNSLHNFTHYVIGIRDKPFVRVGKFPNTVFAPEGGWNWAVCKYKWLRLPFVSYKKGDFRFYLGWRERGNFGIKLNF